MLYKIVGYLEEDECLPSEVSNLEFESKYKSVPFYESISAGVWLEEPEEQVKLFMYQILKSFPVMYLL